MRRFVKSLAVTGAALLVGATMVATAFAWPGDLEGQPTSLHAGGDLGYYIWHDETGLHLRTTGPGSRHVFRGHLQTDGEFEAVHLVRLEGDDGFVVHAGQHAMDLRFETWDGIDGLDFVIQGGSHLRLALFMDGALIPTDQIYLGAEAVHPPSNPFVLHR